MIKKVSIALALSFSLSLGAQEAGSKAFTLDEAQKYALENAFQVKLASADVDLAIKQKKQIQAIGLPQVSAEAKFQNFIDIPTTLIPASSFNPMAPEGEFMEAQFGTKFNNTLGVQASQLLFDGSYLVGLKVTKGYVGLYQQQKEKSELDVKEGVTQAYYNIIAGKESKEVLERMLTNMTQISKETAAMYEAGFVDEQTKDQIALTLATLNNNLQMTDRQIAAGKYLLAFQMGYINQTGIDVSQTLDEILGGIDNTAVESQQFTMEKHVDVRILNTTQELMRLNWKKEQSANLPSLSAFLSHQQVNMGDELKLDTWYPTTLWGINLNVPIFGSGQKMYTSQMAKIEHEKTQLQLAQVQESLKMNSQVQLNDFKTNYESYQINKQNLTLAEKIHNNTMASFQQGVASSQDVSESQNQLLDVQRNYVMSIVQLLNSKLQLDKTYSNL